MARINDRSIQAVTRAQGVARVNNHNSEAIIAAQAAFVACKCAVCTARAPRSEQCNSERKLLAEIKRGEDMFAGSGEQ